VANDHELAVALESASYGENAGTNSVGLNAHDDYGLVVHIGNLPLDESSSSSSGYAALTDEDTTRDEETSAEHWQSWSRPAMVKSSARPSTHDSGNNNNNNKRVIRFSGVDQRFDYDVERFEAKEKAETSKQILLNFESARKQFKADMPMYDKSAEELSAAKLYRKLTLAKIKAGDKLEQLRNARFPKQQ